MRDRIALLTAKDIAPLTVKELSRLGIPFSNPTTLSLKNQDVLVIEVARTHLPKLFRLRTVEDIFVLLLEQVPLSERKDIRRMTPVVLKDKLQSAVQLSKRARSKGRGSTSFWVFVKQDEDHDVRRHDIAGDITAYVERSFSRWTAREPAEVELWVFLVSGRASLGLRLTDIAFRQRRYKVEERPGSLRPTLAAAMVVAAKVAPNDVVFDPMCGVGTVLLECAAAVPDVTLFGADRDQRALDLAQNNAKKADCPISFERANSTNSDSFIPLEGRVSLLICNLPFGKQHSADEDLAVVYRKAIQRWRALLAPGGRMVLLSSRGDLIKQAASRAALNHRPLYSCSVQGIRGHVVELSQRDVPVSLV